jgi:hypothetical protein
MTGVKADHRRSADRLRAWGAAKGSPDGFELVTVAEPAPCDIGAPLAALLEQLS